MSYYKEHGKQSQFRADRLPVYVFPAFVGSGRMLLGMTLAGLMTAVIMHSSAAASVAFWWLAAVVYVSSVIMVATGIYAINTEPQPKEKEVLPPPPPRRPAASRAFTPPELIGPEPAMPDVELTELGNRLGDLLVKEWRLLNERQLARAQSEQEQTGQSLVQVLGRLGMLSDEDLERILEVRSAALDPWHDSPRHD
ncbi:MAG: hypothetical protein JXA57_01095 [Armatimonadetes bacterium]|nr:hypothetical protein [Armatimonadota bacterium]